MGGDRVFRGFRDPQRGGRIFTNLNGASLDRLVGRVAELAVQESWVSADVRPERSGEWLNAILAKVG